VFDGRRELISETIPMVSRTPGPSSRCAVTSRTLFGWTASNLLDEEASSSESRQLTACSAASERVGWQRVKASAHSL